MQNEVINEGFITLSGEYDVHRSDDLERQLAPADHADIAVIDVTAVTYADSSAINALVRLRRRMLANGGRGIIRLIGAQRSFRRLLALTALDNVFDLGGSIHHLMSAPRGSVPKVRVL